jgi:hypothetical protein
VSLFLTLINKYGGNEKDMTQWKKIEDYPSYEVSKNGNVRSYYFNKDPKPLKPSYNADGYATVRLYNNGDWKTFYIHRLVMAAFEGPCPDGMEVHHKNENRSDNRFQNLCYIDRSEHMSLHMLTYPMKQCLWVIRNTDYEKGVVANFFDISQQNIGRGLRRNLPQAELSDEELYQLAEFWLSTTYYGVRNIERAYANYLSLNTNLNYTELHEKVQLSYSSVKRLPNLKYPSINIEWSFKQRLDTVREHYENV